MVKKNSKMKHPYMHW